MSAALGMTHHVESSCVSSEGGTDGIYENVLSLDAVCASCFTTCRRFHFMYAIAIGRPCAHNACFSKNLDTSTAVRADANVTTGRIVCLRPRRSTTRCRLYRNQCVVLLLRQHCSRGPCCAQIIVTSSLTAPWRAQDNRVFVDKITSVHIPHSSDGSCAFVIIGAG